MVSKANKSLLQFPGTSPLVPSFAIFSKSRICAKWSSEIPHCTFFCVLAALCLSTASPIITNCVWYMPLGRVRGCVIKMCVWNCRSILMCYTLYTADLSIMYMSGGVNGERHPEVCQDSSSFPLNPCCRLVAPSPLHKQHFCKGGSEHLLRNSCFHQSLLLSPATSVNIAATLFWRAFAFPPHH